MARLLDGINQPADLKKLSLSELQILAREIREELVTTVIETGGHLASNLGAVELTLAIHSVFDSPKDKIVWDVGHQSYVHKLLTGRRDRFATIRQYGGLAGFPAREESPHDAFGTGHASTSVSAALGMAIARDLNGADYHVLAVIGDGALTGGMALEALNQAGSLGTRLIVVVNDNAMSISANVGAMSRSLNRLRLDRRYHRAKEEAEKVITGLPLGPQALVAGKRVKQAVKGLVIPVMMWEELGFTYVGPVDGHNILELQEALRQARSYPAKPTFVHVLTKKGKGYDPAEEDAVSFHGVPPNGGQQKVRAPSYTKVFGEAALRLARENPRLVAITAAMLDGTGLATMAKSLPQRVIDVGICEQHAVTLAAGMATQGLVPLVAIYSTFLQRSFDQVLHDVCTQNLHVVFALDRAGIVGDDGRTHQGTFDLSYLRLMPNMVVAAPKDENELQHLLCTAVNAPGPFALRYPRGAGVGVPLDPDLRELPIGKGELLREGDDLAIFAVGVTVYSAMEAAQLLSRQGVECAVVNARFVKPLDADLLLGQASRTGRVVTVEENTLVGGFGSAVLELLQNHRLQVEQVLRVGIADEFVEHGTQDILRSKYGLNPEGLVHKVLSAFPSLAKARRIGPVAS